MIETISTPDPHRPDDRRSDPPETAELLDGLRCRLPRVVDAAVAAFVASTGRRTADAHFHAGRDNVRDSVVRHYELAAAGEPWSSRDLDRFAAPMRMLGRARVPHAQVLRVSQGVQYAVHSAWWHVADQAETPGLVALGAWSGAHAPTLLEAFDAAYREGLASSGSVGELRTATCRALLDGRAVAADPVVPVETAYAVVVVVAEDDAAARTAHGALQRDAAVLACVVGDAVTVLVPAAAADDAALSGLVGRLRAVRRVAVVDDTAVAAVPAAHAEAVELVALAAAADDPRTLLRADDLQLDRCAAAHRFAGLDRLLQPLDAELVQTVDLLYRNGLDRSRTATALFVHRNTVDYRLRRVAALTGVSPVSVRGIQLYATALTRYRLRTR